MSPEPKPHDKQAEKLVYMANQIGQFFASQRNDQAVAGITDHISKFWDPRMRAAIVAHLDATGGEGLLPPVKEAVENLRAGLPQAKAS